MRPPLYYGNILAYFGIIIHLEFAYTFLTQKPAVKKYVLLADKIKKTAAVSGCPVWLKAIQLKLPAAYSRFHFVGRKYTVGKPLAHKLGRHKFIILFKKRHFTRVYKLHRVKRLLFFFL